MIWQMFHTTMHMILNIMKRSLNYLLLYTALNHYDDTTTANSPFATSNKF